MLSLAVPASAETLVLTAARLLDVESGEILEDAAIVVVDGKILEINPDSTPAGAILVIVR